MKGTVHGAIKALMIENHGRLLSVLIANLRDFQLAEDCLQEALTSAIIHWERRGIPSNPSGWILQTARRKAIDKLRRAKNFEAKSTQYGYLLKLDEATIHSGADQEIPDERLRLIFTCCHPALDQKTRVALTLRTLGGLTTAEIANAYLDREPAMAQRLVRARRKIAKARVPYRVPTGDALPERLNSVLTVVYLIFNEGYSASSGETQLRVDLCEEAIFLARMVNDLMPNMAETEGLLALMLLIHSRRNARTTPKNVPVALEDQHRDDWDDVLIKEGIQRVETALKRGVLGPFQIQAAIQAVHAEAPCFAQTRWLEILGLYDLLLKHDGSTIVKLNRAVALSYVDGPHVALAVIREFAQELSHYHPFHAACADFLRRLGKPVEAVDAYNAALEYCENAGAKRFLQAKKRQTKKEAEQMLGLSPTGR